MPGIFNFAAFLVPLVLIMYIVPVFPLLYVIVKWRSASGTSGAGTHGLMLYFTTVSVLIALAAAANLTYGAISVGDVSEGMTRTSWGLLVGALAFCLLNIFLMRAAAPLRDPTDVVRVFVGFVAVISGIIAMGALIALTISMFQEAVTDRAADLRSDAIRMFGSWCFYYLVTYLLTTRLLARNARES